jgi:transcriptional regulator with PAS, ATPase and Fis domain
MVKEHTFREDLYYRLNVIPLRIPPLRERQQDIIVLTRYFLDRINQKYGWEKSLSKDVIEVLHDYEWPGNIRELKNIIERVVVMSPHNQIEMTDLPNQILKHQKRRFLDNLNDIIPLKEAVGVVEYQLIEKAYERYGNVREAAKALGIDASTFVRKRQRYQK